MGLARGAESQGGRVTAGDGGSTPSVFTCQDDIGVGPVHGVCVGLLLALHLRQLISPMQTVNTIYRLLFES